MVERRVKVVVEVDAKGAVAGAKQAEEAVAKAGKAMKRAADDSDTAAKQQESAFSRMAKSAQENERAWSTAGTALAGFGTATAAGLGASAKAAVDWQSSFAGVMKTVDDSAAGYEELSEELREMARTLPASHAEIAAVAEAAGQLGVAREDITQFTKVMIDLGETTNLTADDAATGIAQIANVMGTTGDDIDNFASTLVALGNAGASTESEILDMTKRLAGAGELAGATEADVLALANAMASVGIEAQLGGGAMSRGIIEMNSAVAEGGDKLEEFARVSGMTAEEFAAQWDEDPVAAVQAFVGGLSNIQKSGGDAAGALKDVGLKGTENASVFLRLSGASDMLNESLALSKTAWEDNSALADEAAKRYETVASQLQVAKNNIVDAGISLGEVFLPAVSAAAEGIQGFAGFLAGLPDEVQALAAGAGTAAASVGLLGGGFLIMTPKVLEVKRAFEDLGAISPRLNTALSTMGTITMAGGVLVGGLVAVGGALGAIQRATQEGMQPVEDFTAALLDMSEAGSLASINALLADLDITVNGLSGMVDGPIDEFGEALDRMLDPNFVQRAEALDKAISFGQVQTSGDRVADYFRQLDTAIAGLVQSGNAEVATEQIEALWLQAEGRGYDREQFLDLFPQYEAALQGVDNQARLAADGLETLNEAVTAEDAEEMQAEAEAARALAEYLGKLAGQSGAMVSFGGALEEMQTKARTWAEEQAAATETADDTWEDFFDGQSVNIDDWITELERMVSAQSNFETNMLMLSGRVSQGFIDEINKMPADIAAPLAAALVDAPQEKLDEAEELLRQGGADMTGAVAEGLGTPEGVALMDAAFEQLGRRGYQKLAEELESGKLTVQEAVDKYDIKLPVEVEKEQAREDAMALVREINQAEPVLEVDADTEPARNKKAELLQDVDTSTGTVDIAGDDDPAQGSLLGVLEDINGSGGTVNIGANAWDAYTVLRGFLNSIPSSVSIGLKAAPGPFGVLGSMFPGFMSGGYTGDGSTTEVAGTVHGQEFVSTASTTSDPYNRAALEFMHSGRSIREWSPPAGGASAGGGGRGPVNVTVPVNVPTVNPDPNLIGAAVAWQVGGLP